MIEIEPDNSKAIDDGRDRYALYVKELSAALKDPSSSAIRRLIDKDSDFERREQNASWRSDCS